MTFACQAHGAKCVKYNSTHKVEHHREMAWFCEANLKTNLPKLKKKGKPCLYSFKCIKCKGGHQADRNYCLFWKPCFNKQWHAKKYQQFQEERSKSICLVVDRERQ